jgi:hypothetical protein
MRRRHRKSRDLRFAFALVLVLAGLNSSPAWATETPDSVARNGQDAVVSTDAEDKPDPPSPEPTPSPSPSPEPSPEPSPSPSPEPSPEPSPSPSTEPSPEPSPTPRPDDDATPPPTGGSTPQPDAPLPTATSRVAPGTTEAGLPRKLQDRRTDIPRAPKPAETKGTDAATLDVGDVLGYQDAWIDSVTSILAGLAPEGSEEMLRAACQARACRPSSDAADLSVILVVGGGVAIGAVTFATRVAKRRLGVGAR